MSSRQTKLQEDAQFRVLRLLQENPDITQRELADHLGISLGGTNYCLRALIEKGLVKIQNFQSSANKLGYAYLLTPRGIAAKAALAARFLKRKTQEYELLRQEIEILKREASERNDPPSRR